MDKQVLKSVLMLLLIVCITVFLKNNFVGGYVVFAQGKNIGFVDSIEKIENVTNKIDDKLVNDYGNLASIRDKIHIEEKIDLKTNLSKNRELVENISELSDFMEKAYVLLINDKEIISFKSYDEMIDALILVRNQFFSEDTVFSFCEKIEYKIDYVTKVSITDFKTGANYIIKNNLLNVKSTKTIKELEDIDFLEEIIYDDTKYEGNSEILQKGVLGKKEITKNIIYINGEEKSINILKENVIKRPVKQIKTVGTKPLPQDVGKGEFIIPNKGTFTSGYGQRWGRLHGGIDLAADEGTPIYASDNGRVSFVGDGGTYGLLIKIDHNNGYVTYYAHCSKVDKKTGDVVEQGEKIAYVGNTGNSTGPHCHFEIRYNNKPLNPLDFIKDIK